MSTPEEEAYARQWPEHAKMMAYTRQAGIIGPFLDWLADEPELVAEESTATILARYFGYDLEKIKIEKSAMLAQARQAPREEGGGG